MSSYLVKFEILNLPSNSHYLNRYCKIVQTFKDRNLTKPKRNSLEQHSKAFHSHHIVPRNFVVDDSEENKVVVSSKEHFVLHWILSKAFPTTGMVTAFIGMCTGWKHYGFRVTGRVFEKMMFEFRKRQLAMTKEVWERPESKNKHKELMKMIMNQQEMKDKMSLISKMVWGRQEYRDKHQERIDLKNHNFQNPIKKECPHCHLFFNPGPYTNHIDGCKMNPNRISKEGHPHSVESRQKMKDAKKRMPKIECPHCHRFFNQMNLIQWHGDKCKMNPIQLTIS